MLLAVARDVGMAQVSPGLESRITGCWCSADMLSFALDRVWSKPSADQQLEGLPNAIG